MSSKPPATKDLAATALYTSATWAWGKLAHAKLLDWTNARLVFRITNFFLWITGKGGKLPYALLHRHVLIDRLLEQSGARRVVELAAGLSRRGVTMTADPSMSYVEVDQAGVFEAKRALLSRSAEGTNVLSRSNLVFVSADVIHMSFDEVAPAGSTPLFVIAEGLLVYFGADTQNALFRKIAAYLRANVGGSFVFDFVPASEQPPPGAGSRFLDWLLAAFTRGAAFVRDKRTRDDIASTLLACGFDEVEMIEPCNVAEARGLPFPNVRSQQLVYWARIHAKPSPRAFLGKGKER